MGDSLYLRWWSPLYLSPETHINFAPLKGGSGYCHDEAGGSSQVSVLQSSCGWGLISTCGMGVSFQLWCSSELLSSNYGGSSLVVVGDFLLLWCFCFFLDVVSWWATLVAMCRLLSSYVEGLFSCNI